MHTRRHIPGPHSTHRGRTIALAKTCLWVLMDHMRSARSSPHDTTTSLSAGWPHNAHTALALWPPWMRTIFSDMRFTSKTSQAAVPTMNDDRCLSMRRDSPVMATGPPMVAGRLTDERHGAGSTA